jgi:type I restriction enzyme R subunit
LANAIHGFDCLWKLKYATTDEGKRFSQYLEMVRQWRNDEAHKAPISTDDEVNAAIKILVAMYLFVTGHSITDLEMAEDHTIPSIAPLHTYSEYDGIPSYGMAAESIDVRDLPEEKRIDLLKQCIVQLTNSSYSKKDAVFTKQRHWEAVYRIAADKGFVIDGDYRYFKQIIDGMSLTNVPELKADTIEKLNKGVYAQAFEDWSPNGLLGKDLSAYNEIHLCGEKFMKIIDAKIPQKK